jgi:glucosyl-3-phosphoglycerate synthase
LLPDRDAAKVTGSRGVDDWLARRTSSIAAWPAEKVAAAKNGQRVAVVLPARDEELTVGDIVAAIVADHMAGPLPLVDEIIVVDSGSGDDTAQVAAAAGARVVTSLLPGKGEAMWHGVAATAADLVVFIDADLEDFDTRFVAGLLGPLLSDPTVDFVKATYDRPVAAGGTTDVGGGRVTELMARPLIAAFWPELSGVLQPLSGEYAARRQLLERLPFRCGYGVDIALLLDTWSEVGIEAIAQVDLYRRHHRHSDLAALGRMAAEVMHTAFDRLAVQGRLPVDLDLATLLLQPARLEGSVGIAGHVVDLAERPPLLALEQIGA